MQKKIKSLFLDVFFVLFCLAGAGFSFYKFYEELNRTLEKQNEEPIADIIVKENIAQRKFDDGTVWDRLRTQAKIYEGDTIHTTAKSLAAVQFIDENSIELGANTLVKVHLKKDDQQGGLIEMDYGNLTVNTFNSSISIKSGNSTISVDANSTINAANTADNGMSVYLKNGTATLSQNGSSGTSLESGVIISYDAAGNITSQVSPEVLDELDNLFSEAPVLIAPVNDFQTSYRTKKPTIRFIWSQLNLATSYQLEIADNPEFKKPAVSQRVQQTSRVINQLKEGKWYWRVTPYYYLNKHGFGTPSETQELTIKLNPELEKPVLLMPKNNDIVSTKLPVDNGSYVYKKVTLSWKENPEAVSYEVTVWDQSSLSPLISTTTTKNYLEIDTSKVDLKNGKWKWSVGLYDSEGIRKISEQREFFAIDDEIKQRTVFPPDGYRISEGRSSDVRYSWKTNIPGDTIFELSNNANFSKVLYRQKTSNNTVDGRTLSPGTYYWRIKSSLEDVELATLPKALIVEPPMPAPVLKNPAPGNVAVVRPDRPFEIKWDSVEGADYYQIKIYASEKSDKVLYEKNYIESTSLKMLFADWAEKQYGITIQAFRDETVYASRASSYLGKYTFRLVMIKPIEMSEPADGTVIDGVDAVKRPADFVWNYVGVPAKSAIVIYKDSVAPENEVKRITNPSMTVKMPDVRDGNFIWTVEGFTEDDYDISSGKYYSYSVTPIGKLAKARLVQPGNNEKFDKNYFIENKTIVFEWRQVENADQYVFTLSDTKGAVLVQKTFGPKETSYEFSDLSKLSAGKFTWKIEAQSLWQNRLFQNGEEAVQTFTIDLGKIKTPKTKEQAEVEGSRYGK